MCAKSFNIVSKRMWNVHYKNDIRYSLQMCQWLLQSIGVWPLVYEGASKLEQILSVILMTTCFSILFFVIVPSSHHIFYVEKDLDTKVKLFGPICFCISSTIKYCYLSLKGGAFKQCIEHMKRDWQVVQDPSHRTIMLKYVTISRKLITVCVAFLYTGGMSYHTVMQFLSKGRSKSNYTLKPLTYPGCDWFLDEQSSPTYEIVFLIHCITAMIMHTVTTAGYSMAAIFVTHICGQIQIQITKLQKLVEMKKREDDSSELLAVIVHDHVEILRFSENVEGALRVICLTEIIESTCVMCLLEYYCLMEWENSDAIAISTYLLLLLSFTFNVFIFCYIGEVLSEQCSQIGTIAYEIEWYHLSAKEAHDLILLILISQYPPKLTAGKIITLSLRTFGSVLKTSVVYLNLLRTVTQW
ncbi:odorant receptor 13a-like [Xylocopa sonorina]|uniref:odorant receptor 13a-like n=1 Tax=Xylocopa sonorina TaxID=1818115 RepID=UPI00403AFB16